MNATVLFTKHPEYYTDIIEKEKNDCTFVSDETQLQHLLLQEQPYMLMIETDHTSLELPLTETSACKPSAIIYGEKEVLRKFLLEPSILPGTDSSYNIPEEFNRKLDKALMDFQFSPSLRGYHYLKQAFYYEFLNTRQISAVKKDIYEAVSNCYGTSIYSVERGITFSIRKAYQKNPEKFQQIFTTQTKAPSNMQFLKTFLIYWQQSGLF